MIQEVTMAVISNKWLNVWRSVHKQERKTKSLLLFDWTYTLLKVISISLNTKVHFCLDMHIKGLETA